MAQNTINRLVDMSQDQKEYLISFMESHTNLARRQISQLGCQGHQTYKHIWNDLANELNMIGPVEKSPEQWMEIWKRLRISAKHSMVNYYVLYNKTGHVEPEVSLNPDDERICEIFGVFGLGLNVGEELGFNDKNKDFCIATESDEAENYDEERYIISILQELNNVLNMQDISYETYDENESFDEENDVSQNMYDLDVRMESAKRPTEEQMDCLVQFMQNNSTAVQSTPNTATALWDELEDVLNEKRGGIQRTTLEWHECWKKLIAKARSQKNFYTQGRILELHPRHVAVLRLIGEEIHSPTADHSSTSSNHITATKKKKLPAKLAKYASQPLHEANRSFADKLRNDDKGEWLAEPPAKKLVTPNLQQNLFISKAYTNPRPTANIEENQDVKPKLNVNFAVTTIADQLKDVISRESKMQQNAFVKELQPIKEQLHALTEKIDYLSVFVKDQKEAIKSDFDEVVSKPLGLFVEAHEHCQTNYNKEARLSCSNVISLIEEDEDDFDKKYPKVSFN